jgi:hypothetical protein
MIEQPWKLEELDPGEKLDRCVQRRMRAVTNASIPARRAAPFFPLERAVYAIVLAVYALYAGARTVRIFEDAPMTGAATFSRSLFPSAPDLPCSGYTASSRVELRGA